ncbi:MAG: CotH kinase family protein [Muribaculaceae bacterium]|nr:CotH kinase family protein [Muribaculaceae bacterium]
MNYKAVFCILAMATGAATAHAELQINEIMQANISSLYADNEFPDSWVELYNNGTTNFRMAGYRLGETENFEEATRISGGAVARAGTYFVIYTDKTGPSGYHVDLRLDSGKGTLYLFNPSGEIVDKLSYKKMLGPNVSYGRVSEGSNEWGFMKTATPGEANKPEVITQVLPDPVFSSRGRVQVGGSSIYLTLSMPTDFTMPADTRLYYTTDGSEPTTSSNSTATKTSMRIASTTVVRAKLISSEAASPNAVTESYIFHPRTLNLPVISINTDQKYFSDEWMGIFAGNNYQNDWRRPINIEYFDATGQPAVINQMGECRVHGAYTRVMPQKSLAVYTQKRFGNKRFAFPFWEAKPGVEEVKSFVLRNGGNCFNGNRIADQAGQTMFGRNAENLDYMENTEVVAYINGQYAGIYDLRERSNEDNIESNYDGLEDIDMVENYTEVKEGTMDSFNDLMTLVNSKPTYEQMNAVVDFDNFAKTVVAQSFVTNTDWPGNNMVMWRPAADGGKWRMVMKDMDFYASSGYNSTFFNFLLRVNGHEDDTGEGNNPARVKIFQVLWQFPEFREKIIDCYTVYLGDFLRKSQVRAHIEGIRDDIDSEYYYHLQTYGKPLGYSSWRSQVENLITWSENRSDYLRDKIIPSYFELGDIVPLNIVTNGQPVKMQNIPLTRAEFKGNYYLDRTLHAYTSGNGWKATYTYTNGTTRTVYIKNHNYSFTPTSGLKSIVLEVDLNTPINKVAGDINGDGVVDVVDVNALVNMMLGAGDAWLGDGTDVNGDGSTDITDINAVIGIISQ